MHGVRHGAEPRGLAHRIACPILASLSLAPNALATVIILSLLWRLFCPELSTERPIPGKVRSGFEKCLAR